MSKKSRGFQPEPPTSAAPSAGEATTTEAASARASRRARRAERSRATTSSGSALERFRGPIIGGIAVLAVGVVGIFLFQGASAAPYTCEALLTPPPASAAGTGAEPAASGEGSDLGFATLDMGRGHLATGTTVGYDFCPPTSGEHWSDGSRSPLRRDVYSPSDDVSPGNWVHNLEHGYVVFAYEGEPSAEIMSQIREAVDEAPGSELSEACNLPNKVIAVRFDDMVEPFAALAWDRALLMPEWDSEAAMAFAGQWQDSPQAPEQVC